MKQKIKRISACIMAVAVAVSCTAIPAFAMEDTSAAGGNALTEHPEDTMKPTKDVFPIGNKTYYKVQDGTIVFADRELDAEYKAVPSAYIKGSASNEDDVDYGMYVTSDGEVHFVALSDCHDDGDGTYTWYHGTTDGATVSEDVDTATNSDPTMSTQFYVNIENGLDPDGTTEEDKGTAATADDRVEYEITVATKSTFNLKTTVPLYVCMYGYRGTGNVITPTKDAYQLNNYSTKLGSAEGKIVDIVRITHFAKIYDEDHSNEELYSIAYDADSKTYTYWYSDPAFKEDGTTPNPEWTEPDNYLVVEDQHINASGECYVICIDREGDGTMEWEFRAAGTLVGDALRETVTAVEAPFELAKDFVLNGWNFGKTPAVGDVVKGDKTQAEGMAVKVTELQAEPSTWRVVPMSTAASEMRRGELAMSMAPEKAQSDASAIDLATCSAKTDITERGWFMEAPEVNAEGNVDTPTTLGIITAAQMAGGNVNDAGCTPVVKVTYTMTPVLNDNDIQTGTVTGGGVASNR